MLITCPECNLQMSDKAFNCPHCGYPLRKPQSYVKSTKFKRLPNGFGQISFIKNRNLRNPWRAMVTVGFNETGRPICKILKPQGYFKTYNDAYAALIEYHKNPYDLDPDMTCQGLFNRWIEEYQEKASSSAARSYKAAWNYCNEISRMNVKEIRARHIKGCMDNAESPNTKASIKNLWNMMLDYAVEYEITDRNYARTFALGRDTMSEMKDNRKEHIPYTAEEMDLIWSLQGSYITDFILVQCYSGWRPSELLNLENINWEEGYMQGGMKTKAGKNRIVPIHPKIVDVLKRFETYDKIAYDTLKDRFNKFKSEYGLNPNHRPHDGRVHFVTMAKKYQLDEYAIKRIVGHDIKDITEKIYTKRDIEWLKEEMEKIEAPV